MKTSPWLPQYVTIYHSENVVCVSQLTNDCNASIMLLCRGRVATGRGDEHHADGAERQCDGRGHGAPGGVQHDACLTRGARS